jgi:hypothetical protein
MLQILKHTFPNFKFNYMVINEIENIYENLKNKNSHSYDEISVKMKKLGTPFISSPLTYIHNKYLSSGIFPSRLNILL